jgi:hypothetical protein
MRIVCHSLNARRSSSVQRSAARRSGLASGLALAVRPAERQRSLAIEIGKNAKAALGKPEGKPKRSGTRKARKERKTS